MDNICFLVRIRQIICQNGVPINIDKTFTNVSNNTVIELSYGYTLTINRASNNLIRYTFTNNTFDITFFFDIDNNSSAAFDLPIQGGTYKLIIFAAMRCCCSCPNS